VDARPGGKRRIDKVLSEDFLADVTTIPLAELRSLRDEADQEETDLSYLRRMLQGRIDLVAAEASRRDLGGGSNHELVEDLPKILGESPRGTPFGLGRFQTPEPTNAGSTRRAEEKLASVDVTDLGSRDDEDLVAMLQLLKDQEREVSDTRKRVQIVFDAASAEVTRRYRDGEASVETLLAQEAGTTQG
jgi:hypothetical protein